MPVTIDGTGSIGGGSSTTLGTAVNSTSGTAIDFTGIPSWVKRITLSGSAVSTNGVSILIVNVGPSSGFVTTGYVGGSGSSTRTNGFSLDNDVNNASAVRHFQMTLTHLGSNLWVAISTSARSDASSVSQGGGSVTLSGPLERLRLTTVNGTDAFDSGTVNIQYE